MTIETRPIEKSVADVLRHAARIIEERGWYPAQDGGDTTCAYLAIVEADKDWALPTERFLLSHLRLPEGMWSLPHWNDTPGRTAEEVTTALRAAADAWEAEHVSSRHQPTNGADSAYELHPYRVLVTEEVGDRWWITVSAAMGKHDARNQAIQVAIEAGYFDVTALKVELIPSNHHD